MSNNFPYPLLHMLTKRNKHMEGGKEELLLCFREKGDYKDKQEKRSKVQLVCTISFKKLCE